ncbi:MAG: hypothetical protein KJ709_00030 [Nanoarchaeota archaeon]|nr:hypothetical protein [Nanoarchaeota archaeon]
MPSEGEQTGCDAQGSIRDFCGDDPSYTIHHCGYVIKDVSEPDAIYTKLIKTYRWPTTLGKKALAWAKYRFASKNTDKPLRNGYDDFWYDWCIKFTIHENGAHLESEVREIDVDIKVPTTDSWNHITKGDPRVEPFCDILGTIMRSLEEKIRDYRADRPKTAAYDQ